MRLGIYTIRGTETDDDNNKETKKDSNNGQLMTDNGSATSVERTVHPIFYSTLLKF